MSDHPAGKLPAFSPGSLGAQESYLRDQEDDRLTVLHTYTLQLIGPRHHALESEAHIANCFLHETEENLTDLLPEGYSVRIREWDAKEETPRERG